MDYSPVAPSRPAVCRAFFAPLQRGYGPPTAFVLGVGDAPADSEYLDALQREAEGLGATWPGTAAVKVIPLATDERERMFQPFFGADWPGGLWFHPNDKFLEFEEDSELRATFPNRMRLIAVSNGTLYFREGDERGWPAGPSAFLSGMRSLVVTDLDESKSQFLLACAKTTVGNLSIIAGCDSLSEFASRGQASAFNPKARTNPNAKHFLSAEETTLLVQRNRQEMVKRALRTRFRKTIPDDKIGSVRTAVKVRAAASGRTRGAELRAHKGDILRTATSSILPGFLVRLRNLSPIWARGVNPG